MSQAESNRVSIRLSEETSWAEVPSSPTMAELPYTSESVEYNKESVKSNTVRADRLTDDIIEVGGGCGGDLNFEYKFGDFELLMEGALGADFLAGSFTGAGGNLDFAAAGGGVQVLTAPAATWTNFLVGGYVRVAGANSANNGVFKITAVSSTTLTINNSAGTVQADADGAVVTTKMARTGTTKKSYLYEKGFLDLSKFISFRGMRVGGWSMEIASKAIVTGTFSLVGEGAYPSATTISGSVTAQGSLSVANATSNVGRLEEGGSTLATKIKSAKFTLNANARALDAVGSKFPIGINLGSFEITGSIEAYFEDLVLYEKFIDHDDSSLVLEIDSPEDDRTIITITNLKFTKCTPVGAGLNQDVMATLEFMAKKNATSVSMMQVDLLT